MKLNWKVRFKNKVWLGSFLSLIVGFVYSMLALFDVFPQVTQNLVVQLLNQVLTFLGLIGVMERRGQSFYVPLKCNKKGRPLVPNVGDSPFMFH